MKKAAGTEAGDQKPLRGLILAKRREASREDGEKKVGRV